MDLCIAVDAMQETEAESSSRLLAHGLGLLVAAEH